MWLDEGGYDEYRIERRFSEWERAGWAESKADNPALDTPNRYGVRRSVLRDAEAERVRGGGWDLPLLQRVVDQFVLHYDASGTSRRCFARLHDDRGLSVHCMLDLDGTIYQTLDLKERAWHTTHANSRSSGIEISNIGAYPDAKAERLREWYTTDRHGQTTMIIPADAKDAFMRTTGFVARPDRSEPVCGLIHGEEFHQFDFTPEQYEALIKLTATLGAVFHGD
ncbi:MAG: N-acetylmuramoyl-L-alanine amidase [Candidatus Synoicihabitans palmerolidicus]|nr:N-acetylmuramoyl-L-alanine amidase [Candidatus Synoicihabitans palmerolidicus]